VAACAIAWTVLPALLLSAPHGDNVEQLNWSHGAAWGYSKHPPLPTFLLRAAIDVFGRSATLTYALAMTCVAAALLVLWRCARLLLPPDAALAALLLSSVNYYLMGRGSFLNHNTVMLPFVALSAWAVLKIASGAGWRAWLMLGLVQALGVLTKYQMGLIACANGLALLAAGAHRQPRFVRHALLAAGATLLPLIPHVAWLSTHQFSTFHYAGQSLLAGLGPGARLRGAGAFLGQQLGRLAPVAIAGAIAWVIDRATRHAAQPGTIAVMGGAPARAFMVMALAPLAGIVALILVVGVAAQNHWGASATLLVPVWLCIVLPRFSSRSTLSCALAVLAVHAGAIAWNVYVWAFNPGPHHRFAAQPLAALVQAYWARHASGDIPVLIGADWEAGSLSIYLPGQPPVVPAGDWTQSPWVDPDTVDACGGLAVGRPGTPLDQQVPGFRGADLLDPDAISWRGARGRESTVQLAYLAPRAGASCRPRVPATGTGTSPP
jgi:4-amino-4-deoxy-L-arabinose transferase-like glycosyltransferase